MKHPPHWDPETFLTPYEASQIIGVAPSQLARWERRGMLPAVRTPGGHRRFRPADVEAFAAVRNG